MHIQQRGNTSKYASLGWWPFAVDPAPWNSPSAVPSTDPSIPALLRTGVSGVPLGTQSAKAPLSSLCWVLNSLGAASPPPTDPRTPHHSAPPFCPRGHWSPTTAPFIRGVPFRPLGSAAVGSSPWASWVPSVLSPGLTRLIPFWTQHADIFEDNHPLPDLLAVLPDGMVEALGLKGLDPQKRLWQSQETAPVQDGVGGACFQHGKWDEWFKVV